MGLERWMAEWGVQATAALRIKVVLDATGGMERDGQGEMNEDR